jgi:hypothetical protein
MRYIFVTAHIFVKKPHLPEIKGRERGRAVVVYLAGDIA